MIDPLDARLNAIRDDLADIRLKGQVVRPRYAQAVPMVVRTPSLGCRAAPGGTALETEFLYGEPVAMFAAEDGWAWVQSAQDGYVGYVERAAIDEPGAGPTHTVAVPFAHAHAAAGAAVQGADPLPMGALVRVAEDTGVAMSGAAGTFRRIEPDRFLRSADLRPIGERVADWVAIAEAFVGTPYLWGGKTRHGIDCSGLVQLALQSSGRSAPRDSDMQAASLGEALAEGEAPRRGDLVFWKGHVGMMASETDLLHANGFHKKTVVEPVAETIARLEKMGLPVTVRRRLDG